MANWIVGNDADNIHLNVNEDSSTGSVTGTLTIDGIAYAVNGNWTANGSVPGRNVSNLELRGSAPSPSAPQAPNFVALSGQISFNGGNPNITAINAGVYMTSSNSGQLFAAISQLTP